LWCDALLKEAVQRRAPLWQAVLASAKAFVDIRLGRLVEAEKSAHSALALVPPEGWGVAMALPVAAIVYAKVSIGRLDEAAVHLSIPLHDAAFQTVGGLLYLWARGHYYLGAGRPYAALDDFHTCGDLMGRWDLDLPAIVPWRTDAAQAYLALRDDRRARALAEEQLARVGAGRSWVRGVTLRGLAATVEPGHRPRLLGEAVEILRERGHRLELARAVGDLSRAHQELGDENAARAAGRKAQQLMRECGIEPPGPEITPRGAHPDVGGGAKGDAEPSNSATRSLRVATLAAQGHTQPGDRRHAVHHGQHCRAAPDPGVPQARRLASYGAGAEAPAQASIRSRPGLDAIGVSRDGPDGGGAIPASEPSEAPGGPGRPGTTRGSCCAGVAGPCRPMPGQTPRPRTERGVLAMTH